MCLASSAPGRTRSFHALTALGGYSGYMGWNQGWRCGGNYIYSTPDGFVLGVSGVRRVVRDDFGGPSYLVSSVTGRSGYRVTSIGPVSLISTTTFGFAFVRDDDGNAVNGVELGTDFTMLVHPTRHWGLSIGVGTSWTPVRRRHGVSSTSELYIDAGLTWYSRSPRRVRRPHRHRRWPRGRHHSSNEARLEPEALAAGE